MKNTHVHSSSNKWGGCITVWLVNGERVLIWGRGSYISVVRQNAIKVEEELHTHAFCSSPSHNQLTLAQLPARYLKLLAFIAHFAVLPLTFLFPECHSSLLSFSFVSGFRFFLHECDWTQSTAEATAVQLAGRGSGERPVSLPPCYLWGLTGALGIAGMIQRNRVRIYDNVPWGTFPYNEHSTSSLEALLRNEDEDTEIKRSERKGRSREISRMREGE